MDTLSGTGIWSGALRYGDPEQSREAAAELDSLARMFTLGDEVVHRRLKAA